jgi:ferrous iron transport protein B
VGQRGGKYVALIFFILFSIMVSTGLLLNKLLKGKSPEILWEIPPYRIPAFSNVLKKLFMRIRGFLKEAVPVVLLGILAINLLYVLNVFTFLANIFSPVLTSLWGLPKETISSLLIGFLRKDVAVGMLAPLNLTTKQLIVACTILSVYFPCMATFIVLLKELGGRDMAKSAALMILTTLIVGTLLNFVL